MGECSRKDLISDMPQGIIDCILTKLPIRDAVRTSILSTKWRFQWSTMTELTFDENCVCVPHGSSNTYIEKKLFDFIMRCLFLHDGPINKFMLTCWYTEKYYNMEQWLRFLSRKDIKVLILNRDLPEPILAAPSAVFSCQQLTSLTLWGFEVLLPPSFQGLPCLKCLNLEFVLVTHEVVENLISGCPLLEGFKFINYLPLSFAVCAPNLKHLILDGNFRHINLEHAPLLVDISIDLDTEAWGGDILLNVPVTYHCLKYIELIGVNLYEKYEALYVLHLLLQSPNVQELQISAETYGCSFFYDVEMNFWEKKCPSDFTFKYLKIVKMSSVFEKKDMEFIKFVLRRSPVLEVMRISEDNDTKKTNLKDKVLKKKDDRRKMKFQNKVLQFQRASPGVDFKFFE